MALRGGVEGLIFLRWGWLVSYKSYCSTTTGNLYAFEDVSVYIMMCVYVVGGYTQNPGYGVSSEYGMFVAICVGMVSSEAVSYDMWLC